jgi:hypothetical protein
MVCFFSPGPFVQTFICNCAAPRRFDTHAAPAVGIVTPFGAHHIVSAGSPIPTSTFRY